MQLPFVPAGGTPLVPPSYLTAYFGIFFLILCALYIYFYLKRRPTLLWQKIKLLIVLAFTLKATFLVGGGLLAAYWLIPAPGVRRTIPPSSESSFSPTDRIEIVFDRPINRSILEKSISPETPGVWVFENSIYTTHLYRKLVFYPTYSLRPDTSYTVKLSGIRNLLNSTKLYDYQFDFTTQHAPRVSSTSPVSGQKEVDKNTKIKVTLDSPNNNISEFDFEFTPNIEYESALDSTKTIYTLTPKTPLEEGIAYNLKIQKTDIILNLEDGGIIERGTTISQYDGNFKTKEPSLGLIETYIKPLLAIGPATVRSFNPKNGWTGVTVTSPVKVSFDQAVDNSSSQKFSITPKVDGKFSVDGNTLIFTPEKPFAFSTTYTVSYGNEKTQFTTQSATTKLAVPAYLQKYTLSCEIAALRMALNFRGLNTSEDELIAKVGLDPTPHKGNVWGNPNTGFVGNIRGTQMKDGYGVHWGPIAKAARAYRNANEFQGWNIEQLTGAIASGNPVVIWVYSHNGSPTSWTTPDGTQIYAVRDEHAVTAVGFVGPAANPSQIIINDPLIGQIYWSRASFDRKWNIFGRSGVVVY